MARRSAGKTWLIVAIVMGWAVATHHRVATVWTSERALWADAMAQAPQKPRPTLNYGRTLELSGDVPGALVAYQHAMSLALDGRRSNAQQRFALAAAETNIAHAYVRQGLVASAMRILDDTLRWYPDWPYGHFNRGSILWAFGACEEGTREMNIGRSIDPSLPWPSIACGALRK